MTALIVIGIFCVATVVAVLCGEQDEREAVRLDQRGWWFGSARR